MPRINKLKWIIEVTRVRTDDRGILKFLIAVPEDIIQFGMPEIRFKLTTFNQGKIVWKRFARENRIPDKNWKFLDEVIKEEKKFQDEQNQKFKD